MSFKYAVRQTSRFKKSLKKIMKRKKERAKLTTVVNMLARGEPLPPSGDYVKFAEPYEGSPADRAGIRPGDRIVAIDGRDAKGYTTDTVSLLLKGEPGSIIRLTVEKFPSEKREELKLRRETINLPGVPYYGFVADSI